MIVGPDGRDARADDPGAVPRVSVVLPLYRRTEYLADVFQSILAQRFRLFELIVVDDGSNDGGRTIGEARRCAAGDPRVRFVVSDRNLGEGKSCGAALNLGFAHARGEYHAWITDDNVWSPECLARLVPALDAGADLVYGPFIVIAEDSRYAVVYEIEYEPGAFARNCCCGVAFAYRASLFARVRPYPNVWNNDAIMWRWMQAVGAKIVSLLPCPPLGVYREHAGTITERFCPAKDRAPFVFPREAFTAERPW